MSTEFQVDDDIAELVPLFLENRHEDLVAIEDALARGDLALVTRLGHSMKGSGISYGFPEISEIGAQIEHAAGAGDEPTVRRLVAQLQERVHRIEAGMP